MDFGGTVELEFKFTYKLHVVIQQRTLFILIIFELCCLSFMNPQVFTDFVASSVFDTLPKEAQQFIFSTMSGLGETVSTGGIVASEGVAPEVVSM